MAKNKSKSSNQKKVGKVKKGNAGEIHQQVGAKSKSFLTTNQGVPISDNQNSLSTGEEGPVLLEDFILREKIFHFDHERIPERIVHARGTGAHGYFELYESLSEYTKADIFQRKGEKTPVFARISTVAGGAGSVDTPRDVRGFAVKFYTKEGNWDLVGNNIPVFFIQDAIKFPDLIHAVKMEADRGYPQAATAHDTFWDYMSLTPEAMNMVMWIMSDRTIPRSLATIEGFGVHTFRLINADGQSTFVKFHWKPKAGLRSTIWDETVKITGADQDFHRRDIFERIDRGDYPEWELGMQLFDQEFADSLPYDVLDPTKFIPEEDLEVKIVGRMVLDRYPENFFAETEQAAFCPSHVVPGIDFSNDPLLQGRLFSYLDTQKSRLGTANFHQLPINSPKCPFSNLQRDGQFQTQIPKGRANYEPNSLNEAGEDGGPREIPSRGFSSAQVEDGGDKLRIRPESFADHYSQARQFFLSMDPAEQRHIVMALIFELSKVSLEHVRTRMLSHLVNIDSELAERVAKGLGTDVPEAAPTAAPVQDFDFSPALRIINGPMERKTIKGDVIGILVANGTDASALSQFKSKLTKAGAVAKVVAPKLTIEGSNGKAINADAQLAGAPSVMFDSVAMVLSKDGAKELSGEAAAVQWVMDAFGHLKAIGYTEDCKLLMNKAGVKMDDGVVELSDFVKAAKTRYFDREKKVRSES